MQQEKWQTCTVISHSHKVRHTSESKCKFIYSKLLQKVRNEKFLEIKLRKCTYETKKDLHSTDSEHPEASGREPQKKNKSGLRKFYNTKN